MLYLTQLREKQGLSKSSLARMANLDQALMSKIELGRAIAYPAQLERLAAALGASAKELTREVRIEYHFLDED